MNNKLRFSLLTLLVMLCGTVFADTYTYEFTKQQFTAADTKALGDANWTVTTDGSYWGYDGNKGQQFGSGSKPAKSLVLATSDITGTISEIKVTTSGASSIAGTLYVTVGGSAFGNQYTLTSTSTEVTFTGSASGEIKLNYAQTSSKAIYIKKIEVTYASAAPEPTGYTVDFNNTIVTNNHDFILGSNWGHVVGTGNYDGYGPYYMSYSYTSDGGFNGTGSLQAYRQYAGDNYGGTECYDLLVTPLVSGEITMKVKASSSASNSNPSYVEIYKIDAAGTTRGDLIQRFTAEEGYTDIEGQDDWKKITLTLTEEQRIAIRAQYVYMDDFTAASVNIIPQKALSVVSVMNMEGKDGTGGTTTYFEQLTDGTLSVPLKVLLSNTGDIDLVSGTTENYSLTLATASSASGTKTYYDDATVNVPTSLAAGASDTVEVIFNIPYTSGWKYYFVKENITGTTSSSNRYAGVTAYEPKFIFRVAESTSTSSLSGVQAYGLISEETTKSFEIANTGTAPLTIKSITLPEGFTSANMPVIPAEGLVIAKGTTQALDITLPITTPGTFSGNLTIVYLDKDAAEKTYTLAFSGNVLPAGTWAADFNGENAIAFPAGSIAEGGINNDYSYSDGAYNYYLKGRTSSSYASENNKFITPKLHATAGQQLTFDVKGTSGSSYYAKVYVSTDRKTWGEPVAYYTYGEKDGAVAIGSSEWVNKAITFDAEGDYYVAFSLYGEFKIDNIIGLTKVDVAHDLYIKSINWPDASVKSGTSLSKPSLDIIPLTDETAEAYTVKYVCGETVLAEGTPVALTASANSSKTFSFSWTPSVESTTVYNGTKVVFEFTDGSKFETEGFDLTVTNEPKFHFVKTLPSSKWYEPTDYTTPISFGKTNTADKQTFYVYNWGSAPLTVKSIVAPDGFTATPAEQFIVAAFVESDMNAAAQAVEITFSATEAGNYSGDLVITYVDGAGADQTFTLAVGGTKIDPAKFYANFDNPTTSGVVWPAGSVYQGIDASSGNYSAPYNYYLTGTGTFITPKLTAAAGDKLLFDAKLYNSSWIEGKVVVYAAATREEVLNAEEGTTRVQLFSVSGQDETNPMTTDYQTFEVTVPEAGDYFFGFEISGRPYVDELYGLTAVAVENDIKIASSVVPTEAMQNVAATATVNILNFGAAEIAADAYTVKVYVDGEVVGNGTTVAIPATQLYSGNGTQVSASFRTPKVGTFPVYVEVKAGDVVVATEPVDVTFTEEVAKNEIAMEVSSTSTTSLLHLNWNNSETVNLYSKSVLKGLGLTEGTKIQSISFKGYNNGSKNYSSALNVWYEFTDDETQAIPSVGKYDTSSMTNALSIDERSWASKEGASDDLVDLITINFAEPVVYNGKSLRIVVSSEATNFQNGTNFVQSKVSGTNTSYCNRNDTYNTYANTQSWVANTYLPAIYIGLAANNAVFSGTVKTDTGAAVEGATITLVSKDADNVQYTGATDAEGAYSINVIQANRTYDVTMKAEGYDDQVVTIKFDGESQTKNFVVSNGNAVPLDIAAGWQQITALPENLGDYYFAIADKTENLMISMARGKNQGGEYNGLYYKTGADAFVDKSMLFTLEANDAYVVMTNAEYNSLMIQTEWNAPYYYRTHDNGGGDKAWGRVKFTYSDDAKAWTIQNGKYFEENANFLGTWSGNVPANAEEMALNKSAEQKGLFRLYAIEKAKYNEYKANLLAADGDEPVDMTALIVNPNANFWTGSQAYGWDVVGNKNVNTATGADDFPCFFEYSDWGAASWKNSIKQTITVPNGYYELKARMMMADGVIAYLTANDQKSENAAIAGTNPYFPNHLSVEVKVVDGKLTIGAYAEASAENLWVNTDNFTLTFLRGLPNASESDYAALAEAIQTADAKTLGFDKDEYAPYANVEALKALTAAKAINPAVKNAPEFVQAATAALTTATWTANADEMNAVYNGDFALCENDGAMAGWQTSSSAGLGGAYHSRAFVLTEGMNNYDNLATFQTGEKHSAGYFRFDETNSGKDCVYTYGNEAGYTMPLKPIIYEMTAQLGGWGQVDKDVTIAIVDAEGQEIATKIVHTPATGVHAGGEAIPFEFEFTPAVAGNYRLQLKNTNTSVDNAIVISNISIVKGYPAGDANLDREVNASDAIATVSFALEVETPSAKAFKAADVNKSNSLTVSDAVGIVNIALNNQSVPSAPARVQHVAENNALALNGNILSLANTTEFVAFQMDVTVAPGAQFRGVELSSRASGLNVSYNRVAENTYRVVAFSLSNDAIEMGEGAICTFDIIGNKTVQVTNIEFADAAARAYALELGETTRINGIAAGAAGAEFFSVGGVKSDKAQKGMNVVRTADGKVKKVLVK